MTEPEIHFVDVGEGENFSGTAYSALPFKVVVEGSNPAQAAEMIEKIVRAVLDAVESNGGEVCQGADALVALRITFAATEHALAEILREESKLN